MKTIDRKVLTLEEVAELTRYSLTYLNKNYMKLFADRGVKILRIAPNAKPRFYQDEVLQLMESAK